MTNEEIYAFLNLIKKDYPNFNFSNDDEYQVWKDTLAKTTNEIAMAKYESHKNDLNLKKKIPDIKLFMFDSQERVSNRKFLLKCKYCKKIYYYEAMCKHEARHRSINYINEILSKSDKQLTKEKETELLNMDDFTFDQKYDDFLESLIPKTSGFQQEILLNIKNSRDRTVPLSKEHTQEVLSFMK